MTIIKTKDNAPTSTPMTKPIHTIRNKYSISEPKKPRNIEMDYFKFLIWRSKKLVLTSFTFSPQTTWWNHPHLILLILPNILLIQSNTNNISIISAWLNHMVWLLVGDIMYVCTPQWQQQPSKDVSFLFFENTICGWTVKIFYNNKLEWLVIIFGHNKLARRIAFRKKSS